jgi:hypothetical protein
VDIPNKQNKAVGHIMCKWLVVEGYVVHANSPGGEEKLRYRELGQVYGERRTVIPRCPRLRQFISRKCMFLLHLKSLDALEDWEN